jgi:molybdenum cofactor synthesis domain-containing protein
MIRVGILTASDKGYAKEREDESGKLIENLVMQKGWQVIKKCILPDDQNLLAAKMQAWADQKEVDLILTTGGTGFSPRDCMPEATLAIGERVVPGIPEAMRYYSLQITPRAMLSRAVAVIRKNTLIINLPGSPKAVKENLESIIDTLDHGIGILQGSQGECAGSI